MFPRTMVFEGVSLKKKTDRLLVVVFFLLFTLWTRVPAGTITSLHHYMIRFFSFFLHLVWAFMLRGKTSNFWAMAPVPLTVINTSRDLDCHQEVIKDLFWGNIFEWRYLLRNQLKNMLSNIGESGRTSGTVGKGM